MKLSTIRCAFCGARINAENAIIGEDADERDNTILVCRSCAQAVNADGLLASSNPVLQRNFEPEEQDGHLTDEQEHDNMAKAGAV